MFASKYFLGWNENSQQKKTVNQNIAELLVHTCIPEPWRMRQEGCHKFKDNLPTYLVSFKSTWTVVGDPVSNNKLHLLAWSYFAFACQEKEQ